MILEPDRACPDRSTLPRWLVATIIALGLHLTLIMVFSLTSARGLNIEGLEGEGTLLAAGAEMAMDVSLVSALPYQPPQNPSPNSVFDKFRTTTQPSLTVRPLNISSKTSPNESLSQILEESAPSPRGAPDGQSAKTDAASAFVQVNNSDRSTANDLWKAIEPCWRRVADKQTVPVTLEVTFSPLGNLARPPVIKRPAGAPLTEALLRSESQALAALSQCGPYLMAFGQSGVSVNFPKGS